MPYKLFNNKANIVSDLISKKRIEKNLSYSNLSDKLQLLGVSLYKNDLFLIEKNRRIVRDFELVALCHILEIDYNELYKLIEFES